MKESKIVIQAWENAAEEGGFHLKVITDSQFLNQSHYLEYSGIIVPDGAQQIHTPELISELEKYVAAGGQLMLVFPSAREDASFSKITGITFTIDYLQTPKVTSSFIGQDTNILTQLEIPPGKYISLSNNESKISNFRVISGYQYGALAYPHLQISSFKSKGNPLLLTPNGQIIASVIKHEKGSVLFVNIPLTAMWERTDAMLLHSFMHYFAVNMLHLPMLSPVPNGVGGIIMNLHLDAKVALVPLKKLKDLGLFNQGPYSIDITAGPDLEKVGDNYGFDVPHNAEIQNWIHFFMASGDAIGSHGGWIHNYFGDNVNEKNEKEFTKYLDLNIEALEKITGKKVVEYSAPTGNQPNWVTRYLERHGFKAYYTTSNTGTAPTRNFRDNQFDSKTIWSFTLLPFGKYSAFEEFNSAHLSPLVVMDWLISSTRFVAAENTARLIYFHPPAAVGLPNWVINASGIDYSSSLKGWLTEAKRLADKGEFRWYTMVELANFMDARREVRWSVENKGNVQTFDATHPISLENQAWLIHKNACKRPIIISGTGNIREETNDWIVSAGNVKEFKFTCEST